MPMVEKESSPRYLTAIVFGLVLVGLGIRWLTAYWISQDTNGDYAVDAIMTQHIATGQILPTFFYGQPYMGVPEIYISSIFFRLFGASLLVMFAGKIIVSILILLTLFGWARDLGGWRAGVATMIFCLMGPLHLFKLYYGATLLQALLLLWWGTRLAIAPPRTGSVFGLGLLAGFSWYTNQLLFATLAAVALLLAFAWNWRLWLRPMLVGVAGFVLGGWPWWIWNLRHNWQSLEFRDSFHGFSLIEGLQYLALRLAELLDLTKLSPELLTISLLIYAVLFAAAGYHIITHYRECPLVRQCLTVLLLLIILNSYCFAISHFARIPAPRYALPFLPVYILLVGLGSASLARRSPCGGWLPVLVLAGIQAVNDIPYATHIAQKDRVSRQTMPAMVDFLQRQKCEAILASWSLGWLNFATHERIAIDEVVGERCAGYERSAENGTRLGFLGLYADQVVNFAHDNGGAVAHTNFGGLTLAYGLMSPNQPQHLLSSNEITRICDTTGHDTTALLLDRDLATDWAVPLNKGKIQTLEIEFPKPFAVCRVRLSSASGRYPPLWRVARTRADGQWETATPSLTNDMWFWSGPRVFWNGAAYRLETTFPAAPTRKLRVHFGPMGHDDELYFSEMFIYAEASNTHLTEITAVNDLLAWLRSSHIRYAFADRWLANQIYLRSGGVITASRENAVFDRDSDEPAHIRKAIPISCPLRADTAVIVRQADAPLTRTTLAALQIPMRETALGPWLIFDFAPGAWRPEFGCYDNLFWTGFACLQNSQWNKVTATHLATLAHTHAAERALRLWPTHQIALRILGATIPQPALPLTIHYGNGVTLTGLTLNTTNLMPGQKLSITTFWKFNQTQLKDHPAVFFHFLDASGKICFQDDFGLLNQTPSDALQYPYPDESIVMQRELTIPPTVAAGRYSIQVGLLNGYTLRRLWPHTDLPTHFLKTILPLAIAVAAEQRSALR